jgi:predicted phage-related endonuclease
MAIGHAAEPFLRECFRIKTGKVCQFDAAKTVRISDRYPAFAASLDGWCVNEDDETRDDVVELKAIGFQMRPEYVADELPLRFTLQIQMQMAVTGATDGWLFAMCGMEPIIRHVPRHDRLIDSMHAHAEAFLKLVETKTPPDVDGNEATTKAIALYHGASDGRKIHRLDERFNSHDARIEKLTRIEKRAKELRTKLANEIRSEMGDAELAYQPSGETYSWKSGTKSRSFRRVKMPAAVRIHQVANGDF